MIGDFWQFQKAINHMHKQLVDVTASTKEVAVGKRNANCISCGAAKEVPQRPVIEGKDGQHYFGQDEKVKVKRGPSPKIKKRRTELRSAMGYRKIGIQELDGSNYKPINSSMDFRNFNSSQPMKKPNETQRSLTALSHHKGPIKRIVTKHSSITSQLTGSNSVMGHTGSGGLKDDTMIIGRATGRTSKLPIGYLVQNRLRGSAMIAKDPIEMSGTNMVHVPSSLQPKGIIASHHHSINSHTNISFKDGQALSPDLNLIAQLRNQGLM